MKSEISIKHDTYMMTIKEVIEAIESAANVKVIKISVTDDVLTFHVEELITEPEPMQLDADLNLCDDCGIKLIECSDCECCRACCDCGNW